MTTDAAMIAHALKWRPWNGGPEEDIFVEFGMSATQYFRRVRQLLLGPSRSDLDPAVIAELIAVCDRRTVPHLSQAG